MLPAHLLSTVLESAPDAMVVVDEAGNVLFVNSQVSALFGYTAAELARQPIESLIPARFHQAHLGHRRDYSASVRVRPMGIGRDLFARRKDGTEFPVEVSLSPIRDGDSTLVAAAIRDVTDRRKIQ
ncbi:MAG: PAS domain S-box protein, partial [Steroidobacteraceae bacterium]